MLHDLDFTKERPLIEFSNNDMDKLSFFCFHASFELIGSSSFFGGS